MLRKNIYLNAEEDEIIKKYAKKWKLTKEETIKKIILEF